MTQNGWTLPPKDITDKYNERCEAFVKDDALFENFKRDTDYIKVLEGNEKDVGVRALRSLNQWGTGLMDFIVEHLDKFRENESVGNPVVMNFGGSVGEIAPSTLRYINTCVEIERSIEGNAPKKVIEIGGGYGGLCKIYDTYFGGFDSYTTIDQPWASKLTAKYLSKFKFRGNIKCVSCEDVDSVDTKDIDLVIADSSLSECNRETQLMYVDKIIKHAKYGYIVYNTVHTGGGFYRIKRVVEELTKTHEVRLLPISQDYLLGQDTDRLELDLIIGGIIIMLKKR